MAEVTPPDIGAEMRTAVSADGTEIAYWTSDEGLPLVLVHGVGPAPVDTALLNLPLLLFGNRYRAA